MAINKFNKSLERLALGALSGEYPIRLDVPKEESLFGSGVSLNVGTNEVTSDEKLLRSTISTAPRASVLVKKKFFSSFKHNNDLQWLDRTERLFLRAVKALMAYKVAQFRAYESLTKLEDFYREHNEINLNLFVDAYNQAQVLNIPNEAENDNLLSIIGGAISNSLENLAYDDYKQDILKVMQRNAFASDIRLTTWIVDPTSLDNFGTGPGTGVIEFTSVDSFTAALSIDTAPNSGTFTLVDPYRIMNINEEDIEVAIGEALLGTFGLFESIVNGEVGIENVDATSIVSAGLELLGIGQFDGTIDVDYIRNRLRNFFLGKTMINAGDTVHLYIRSDKNVHKTHDFIDEGYFEIDETVLEAERRLFTNNKIDLETYKNLRKFSDNSFGMRHVFAGVVGSVDHAYSNGGWRTTIDVKDNMAWLQWSRYMQEPAISDPQGLLEDPLTPYILERGASGRVLSQNGPQLLPENKNLINSGLLKYDSGILNGQYATESNLLQGQYNAGGSLHNTKIFQHPSGLVYRWKTGIVTATAGIDVIDPINEDAVSAQQHRQFYALQVAQGVLNNLDVANILSILIVGQPYNAESFIRQAYQVHNANVSSASKALNGQDPLSGVLDVVRRQNKHFGNFRPYRMITLSSKSMNDSFSSNLMRDEINNKLVKLRSRSIELQRRKTDLIRATGGSEDNPSVLVAGLNAEIAAINETIDQQVRLAQQEVVSKRDVLSENFNLFGNNRVLPLTGEYTADAEVTRAMMVVGAQRRIEDVRLNRDQNLFIVSDQYDENTDIRPFILALKDSNYKVFQGTYVSVYEKCEAAAKIPNFEFFCNSQGHLEFRPPQWNKTPLSILQDLFRLKNEENINVIPDFLEDLFDTKASALKFNIHKLNLRIAIIALLLGKYPDRSLLPGMARVGENSLRFFGIKPAGTGVNLKNSIQSRSNRLSNAISNTFGSQLSLDLSVSEEGDILNGNTSTILGEFDPIFQEQNNVLDGVLNVNSGSGGPTARSEGYASPDTVNTIRDSFRASYGEDVSSGLINEDRPFSLEDFAYSDAPNPYGESDNITKINSYLNKLEQAVSDRDELVTILNQVKKKQKELGDLENILTGSFTEDEPALIEALDKAYNAAKSITDVFNGSASEGSLFDHLIEDDTRNLLGPGSGKRFIIYDRDIIRATFNEQPPDFVRVNVYGNNPFIGDSLQSRFEDTYYWAGATDFDMWRQYGFKDSQDVKLPYANNSETQCRPFAHLELQMQRVKINSGSLTLVGNEYYEPGDTVYVKTKGLLYYVRSVSHSFNYGSSFTTTLQLANGHPPGVYLPSPLDIIGQQVALDDPTSTILAYRNIRGDDSYRALQPDTSIVFPPGPLLNSGSINVLLDYKDNMVRYTNMMIELSSLVIGNRAVLIRGFSRGNVDDDTRINNNLNIVKDLLLNPQMITQDEPLSQNDSGFSNLGNDLLDAGSNTLRDIGVETGSSKNVVNMTLPNGLPVIQLSPEQIIIQKVSLGPDAQSEIKCVNAQQQEALDSGDAAILPKGGPKQRTWLDFRDDLTQVSNIIEIGILDIDRALTENKGDKSGVKYR